MLILKLEYFPTIICNQKQSMVNHYPIGSDWQIYLHSAVWIFPHSELGPFSKEWESSDFIKEISNFEMLLHWETVWTKHRSAPLVFCCRGYYPHMYLLFTNISQSVLKVNDSFIFRHIEIYITLPETLRQCPVKITLLKLLI